MTEKGYFRVITEEVRGGVEKSREFIVEAEGFGKVLYKYHQTVRLWGYDDTTDEEKHRLHKNGNVMNVADIEEIDDDEFEELEENGVTTLEKQV